MNMSLKVLIYFLYLLVILCCFSFIISEHLIKNKNLSFIKESRLSKGFTLAELIVTVLVIAIIATIAVPFVLTQLANMEAKSIRNTVNNTLSLAKAESLIRRKDLLVCLSDGDGICNKNANTTLLLFADNNDNKNYDIDIDLLIKEDRLSPKYSNLHLRAGRRHYTKFWGDSGKPRGHFGHIKYCPNSTYNTNKYQISFNQVGIIKYKTHTSHDTDCD